MSPFIGPGSTQGLGGPFVAAFAVGLPLTHTPLGINANASLFLSSSSLPGPVLTVQLPLIRNSSQTAQQLAPAAVLPLQHLVSGDVPGIVVSDGIFFVSTTKYKVRTTLPRNPQMGGSDGSFRSKWRLALQLFPSSNTSDAAAVNASQVVNLWQQPGAEVLDNFYYYDQASPNGDARGDFSMYQNVVGLFNVGHRVFSSVAFVNGAPIQYPCGYCPPIAGIAPIYDALTTVVNTSSAELQSAVLQGAIVAVRAGDGLLAVIKGFAGRRATGAANWCPAGTYLGTQSIPSMPPSCCSFGAACPANRYFTVCVVRAVDPELLNSSVIAWWAFPFGDSDDHLGSCGGGPAGKYPETGQWTAETTWAFDTTDGALVLFTAAGSTRLSATASIHTAGVLPSSLVTGRATAGFSCPPYSSSTSFDGSCTSRAVDASFTPVWSTLVSPQSLRHIYAANFITALTPNGTTVWSFDTLGCAANLFSCPSPCVLAGTSCGPPATSENALTELISAADSSIYALFSGFALFALNGTSGALIWSFKGYQGSAAPTGMILAPDGTLWVTCTGSLFALSPCPTGVACSVTSVSAPCIPGTANPLIAQSACTPCASGSYAELAGQATCSPCPAGTWSAERGSLSRSSCVACNPGSYSAALGASGAGACTLCPAGAASTTPGAASNASCVLCAGGFWSSTPGATSCQACPAGTASSVLGATSPSVCQACLPGSFSVVQGVATCTQLCPPGTAAAPVAGALPTSQATACAACAAGSFAAQAGLQACAVCPAGSWSAAGAAACTPCPPGTASDAANATSVAACSLCAAGSFASVAGTASCTQQCPAGTFGLPPTAAQPPTSAAVACAQCPAGSFSPQPGATACSDCAVGSYSSGTGAAACTPCPVGYFGVAPRATNLTTGCSLCPLGSFAAAPGQTSCSQLCPAGTRGAATNASLPPSSAEAACVACDKGSFSAAGALSCSYCAVGTFADSTGMVACTSCAAGTYGTMPGLSNETEACTPCPSGTYNTLTGQSVIACVSCPAGTASAAPGATSKAACLKCAAGHFAPAGAVVCAPCPVGTFAAAPGAGSCTPCPRNTYNALEGGASAAACLACLDGTATTVAGTSDAADCVANAFVCPKGTFSSVAGGGAATSLSQCLPLACPFPLLPALADGTPAALSAAATCVGCAAGFSGAPSLPSSAGGCAPCGASRVCPGFVAAPLPNALALARLPATLPPSDWFCARDALGSVAATSAASSAGSASAAKLAAAAAAASAMLDPASLSAVAAGSFVVAATFVLLAAINVYQWAQARQRRRSGVLSSLSFVAFGGSTRASGGEAGFGASTAAATPQPLNLRERRRVQARACSVQIVSNTLEAVDAFALAHSLRNGEGVFKKTTALGGACTVAGACTLAVLASVLVLRRQADNVLAQQSLAVLDAPSLAAIDKQPWSLAKGLAAPAGGISGGNAGAEEAAPPQLLRVRVLVAGDASAACGAPTSWSAAGLKAGAFALRSPAAPAAANPCSAGATPSLSSGAAVFQLVWTCADCLLSATSALTFALPYACQSLAIEVAAAAADGSTSVLASGSNGGPLKGTGNAATPAAVLAATGGDAASSAAGDDGAADGGLLQSLEWSVLPLLDVLSDQQPGAAAPLLLGYTLIDGGTTTVRVGATVVAKGNGTLAPLVPGSAGVRITLRLPLQPYFTRTTLTQKESLLQLFASIVGLSGVFSVFGLLFQQAEGASKLGGTFARRPDVKERDGGAGVESASGRGGGGGGSGGAGGHGRSSLESPLPAHNPMYFSGNRAAFEPTSTASAAASAAPYAAEAATAKSSTAEAATAEALPWTRYRDGEEVWFVSPDGVAAWELPEGATSVDAAPSAE